MARIMLGESLIERGLITESQLREALHAQLIYGGHLGTCLIELGHVSERQLGHVLAELFDVHYASPEMFQEIPGNIIHILTKKVVERQHVIPFGLTGNTPMVAMIDPKNPVALDEVSAVANRRIIPWVAPEVRIFQAMERYYDIPRRQRYIAVCRELDRNADQPTKENDLRYKTGTPPWQATWEAAKSEMQESNGDRRGKVPQPRPEEEKNVILDLDRVQKLLCCAESAKELAEIVLNYACQRMSRCILFMVKVNTATIWASRGLELSEDQVRRISFPINPDTIFGLTLEKRNFRGSVPDRDCCHGFFEALRMETPHEIMLLPVYLDDRLIAFFYGDCGQLAGLPEDLEEYGRLMEMVALSLNLVIIRNKILAA